MRRSPERATSLGSAGNGPIICSACLLGVRCRYDGEGRANPAWTPRLERLAREGRIVAVCPEQLGGLPTPRPPAGLVGGDGSDVLAGRASVVTVDGNDVTAQFIRGAGEVLHLARLTGCRLAVLKSGSPSCGTRREALPGEERGPLTDGVTAALLRREGLGVMDECTLARRRHVEPERAP